MFMDVSLSTPTSLQPLRPTLDFELLLVPRKAAFVVAGSMMKEAIAVTIETVISRAENSRWAVPIASAPPSSAAENPTSLPRVHGHARARCEDSSLA